MTVQSFVQQGHSNTGLLDSGPYSADQWALWLSAFNATSPSLTSIRAGYLNEFLVTNPSGTNINIDSGAAIVNGRPVDMDSDLTCSVSSPSANPRVDVVGLCLNNTGIARTAGIASGNSFIFPTDLTDYGSVPELPPYTVRPVILQGTESATPTAPTLDSDKNTLFMIPLYQYEISTGGTISNNLDLRRFDSLSPSTLIYKLESGSGEYINADIQIPNQYRNIKMIWDGAMNENDPNFPTYTMEFLMNVNSDGISPSTSNYRVANLGIDSTPTYSDTVLNNRTEWQFNFSDPVIMTGEMLFPNPTNTKYKHLGHGTIHNMRFFGEDTDFRFFNVALEYFPTSPIAISSFQLRFGATSGGATTGFTMDYAK